MLPKEAGKFVYKDLMLPEDRLAQQRAGDADLPDTVLLNGGVFHAHALAVFALQRRDSS